MQRWRVLQPVLLPASLVCLLVLLAFLQYRWSGQAGEAERLRMQGGLQLAVDQFRQEFARELLASANPLLADAAAVEAADWDAVAEVQSEQLPTGAPHLITAVYLVLAAPSQTLLRLDPEQKKYVPVSPPEAMKPMLARLAALSEEHRPGPPRNLAWAMDGTGPCLIHMLGGQSHQQPEHQPTDRPSGFQLLLLNPEYLSQKLFPELASRHFSGPDGFLYQTQISSPEQVIFHSAAAPAPAHSSDLEVDLIELRPRPGSPNDRGRDRPFAFRNRQRSEHHPPPASGGGPRGFNMPLLVSDGIAPWTLSVRHREGSVAAAVQTSRWRNLAVSFAILLVLGAGMLTIVRNTQRAQHLAELQMEFVAGVSHEIRTPLAVISSAAENLTDGVVDEPARVQQYGSLIRNESRRLSGMMEQILQFAAGRKRAPYKPVPLALEELIRAALALSQSNLNEGGFTVECRIPPDLPEVRGESGALTQCLQNLISNAAKYSGGSRWIGITAEAQKTSVSVTVEDKGIGIDPADLPHLFDAFFRSRAVRSAQIHGTGLGLNLAQSFARDAGGEITVQSTVGQGSRFTLRLPCGAPSPQEAPSLLNQTV